MTDWSGFVEFLDFHLFHFLQVLIDIQLTDVDIDTDRKVLSLERSCSSCSRLISSLTVIVSLP
jgi:hypothetical protein